MLPVPRRCAGYQILADALAQVPPKELSADDMEMRVRLALHAVSPEVGKDTKSVGAMLLAHLRREAAHVRQQIAAAPQFGLSHVRLGDDEYLHGHPVELVVEDDDAVVLEVDCGRFAAGDDFAEDAVRFGHGVMGLKNAVKSRSQFLGHFKLFSSLTDDLHNLVGGYTHTHGFDIKGRAFTDFGSQDEGLAISAADDNRSVPLSNVQERCEVLPRFGVCEDSHNLIYALLQ